VLLVDDEDELSDLAGAGVLSLFDSLFDSDFAAGDVAELVERLSVL
jgi:hypothetical protein